MVNWTENVSNILSKRYIHNWKLTLPLSKPGQENTTKNVSWILVSETPWQAQAVPNSFSLCGVVTSCIVKQNYSAAAGFHTWFPSFTSHVPAQGHSRKARRSDSIILQATNWAAVSYCSFTLCFPSHSLIQKVATFSPSLPSPSHLSAFWKQAEESKWLGAHRRREWLIPSVWGLCIPLLAGTASWFAPSSLLLMKLKAAWSSPPLPHNTSGCTKKYFPSEVSPLGQAHSAFEWNKNGCTTSGICMLPHLALVTTDRKAAPSEGGPHPRCCVA